MSRHYKRQWRYRNYLAEKINHLFDRAIESQMDFDTMINIRSKYILGHKYWDKLTRYNRSHLEGVWATRMRDLHRNHLEWRVLLDGKHMVGSKVPKGAWDRVTPHGGRHFWKDTDVIFWDQP